MIGCSGESRARDEPQWATASTGQAFLLIEDAGPWGPAVLHSHRLPESLRDTLARWRRDLGVRTLLIRRPGRAIPGPRRVFAANARHGWLQSRFVDDLAGLADLDPSGFRERHGIGWPSHPGPVLLVCTHGRHDPCCATRGRPVAAAIAEGHPELLWEASHLGGDRFAGNLVVLPRGDYFGRLDADSGPRVVDAYLAGALDLTHHRGRSSRSWVVQAAEAQVRWQLGATGLDDVVVTGLGRDGPIRRVRLLVHGQEWVADVRVIHQSPALLTYESVKPQSAPGYQVTLVGPE